MPRGRPRKNQRQQELPKNPLPVIKDSKTEQVETKTTNPMTEINTSPLPTKEIFSSSKKKRMTHLDVYVAKNLFIQGVD